MIENGVFELVEISTVWSVDGGVFFTSIPQVQANVPTRCWGCWVIASIKAAELA